MFRILNTVYAIAWKILAWMSAIVGLGLIVTLANPKLGTTHILAAIGCFVVAKCFKRGDVMWLFNNEVDGENK